MKKYLISFTIVLLVAILGFIFFIKFFPNRNIIIIGNTTYEKYNNNIYGVNNNDDNLFKNKYKVYSNYNYLGNYYLNFDNRWILTKDNGNEKNYDGEIIAIDEKSNIVFGQFISSYDSNDIKELEKFLNNYDIYDVGNPLYQKFYGDFDDDGIEEKLVSANNIMFDDDKDNHSSYSLLYIYDDNNYNLVYFQNYTDNQVYTDLLYYAWHIFKFNNKYYCSVLNTYYGQAMDDYYSLYELSDSNIKVYDNNLKNNESNILSIYYNSKNIFVVLLVLLGIDIICIIIYNMSNKNNEI